MKVPSRTEAREAYASSRTITTGRRRDIAYVEFDNFVTAERLEALGTVLATLEANGEQAEAAADMVRALMIALLERTPIICMCGRIEGFHRHTHDPVQHPRAEGSRERYLRLAA